MGSRLQLVFYEKGHARSPAGLVLTLFQIAVCSFKSIMNIIEHSPSPGSHGVFYCGDSVSFRLVLDHPERGGAWLRTNIGHAADHRREIIEHVEQQQPILSRDWHDLPMQVNDDGTTYHLDVPLADVGRFQAKAFFLPEGKHEPIWTAGDNIVLKVEPATGVCGNTLYSAFARPFGPNIKKHDPEAQQQKTIKQLDDDGYTVIPKSGTFRGLIRKLDHIIDTMGFQIVQLLPIHPVPTTYARMGRFGSPFASIDFFDIDPALAEFDRKTTPLDQFGELADSIHAREARVFIDLPINHTGWASHLQIHHPDWFAKNNEDLFVSPGAWGVTWEDLSELDYAHRKLWQYMADVFLFWCRHGVDGFRCDAGYMVPKPTWEYIVAKVREEYPDTVFLLEGLGGKVSVTKALLDEANLNWAYSELFQEYDRQQLESYIPGGLDITRSHGTLIHFAETHDNARLAATSQPYARLRTALAALCSEAGTFGITNGVEWFATTQIDVHGAPPLNWGSHENQVETLARINQLLKNHPGFRRGVPQRLAHNSSSNAIAYLRSPKDSPALLIAANLNLDHAETVSWPKSDFAPHEGNCHDLITGEAHQLIADGTLWRCTLEPAQILCLSAELESIDMPALGTVGAIPAVIEQRQKAEALRLYRHWTGKTILEAFNTDTLARQLIENPVAFCETVTGGPVSKSITTWQWPQDQHRTVMLPHMHTLLVKCANPFRAELQHGDTRLAVNASLEALNHDHIAFITVPPLTGGARELTLRISISQGNRCAHSQSSILQLPSADTATVALQLQREDLRDSRRYALLTNNRGAMSQVRLEWGTIASQYDCLLGANLHNEVPVDRHIAFTRCQSWLIHRGYSQAINTDCIRHVAIDLDRSVTWTFDVPAGLGKTVSLQIGLNLVPNENRMGLSFARLLGDGDHELSPDSPITLILRPDIESRNFHETTKAFSGPEHHWPSSVTSRGDGFLFTPHPEHRLDMSLQGGQFIHEAEWTYGVAHPFEADRGLSVDGDLFSPGYFKISLKGAETTELLAQMLSTEDAPSELPLPRVATAESPKSLNLADAMRVGMQAFIVKREDTRTVIAGYPWFLDWGRDTLICLRGIIAAGFHSEARDILIQFARFEDRGTLPNMIRGNDDSNRDTSDAPLWFFTACADLLRAEGNNDFLAADCRGRTMLHILVSIATHYIEGTPNGIIMDPDTGLIFSPSHYTWMDTNHPAGTPREGYPVEIQALWFAALSFLNSIDDNLRWKPLSEQVQTSLQQYFRLPDRGYLSDVLLAAPGTPAKHATPDNALRPNQLFAITLGAITDKELATGILSATEQLLIPGAIRSLADQPVAPPLPVYRDGQLLNDPERPFWPIYQGDEDTRRKPAYHNGTAWSWPFPSYCEALVIIGGEALKETARSLLGSGAVLANDGCIGHIPEILDASTPHHQRGCGAQAWGDTELYRVLSKLSHE